MRSAMSVRVNERQLDPGGGAKKLRLKARGHRRDTFTKLNGKNPRNFT